MKTWRLCRSMTLVMSTLAPNPTVGRQIAHLPSVTCANGMAMALATPTSTLRRCESAADSVCFTFPALLVSLGTFAAANRIQRRDNLFPRNPAAFSKACKRTKPFCNITEHSQLTGCLSPTVDQRKWPSILSVGIMMRRAPPFSTGGFGVAEILKPRSFH